MELFSHLFRPIYGHSVRCKVFSFFISFLLPFCNHLYIMVLVVVFYHNMLHFDEQERCYDSFDRRREGI